MADVRLTQLDGKLPNLALVRLSAWHKDRGDAVHFHTSPDRKWFEPDYDVVYGSAIFSKTADDVARFKVQFPSALVGGSWNIDEPEFDPTFTVEKIVGAYSGCDYSHWPEFTASMGFSQRGCRLSCKFCGVRKKEGRPSHAGSIAEIYRGQPHPKHIHLLDNDFFGGPYWQERAAELRDGGFAVCFSQGINTRLINQEAAETLASLDYRDDQFRTSRLYTAWDNLKDERVFFDGVDRLEVAGVKPTHLMVYMLIGYDKNETWARVFHRFNRMLERGIKPYPMCYGDKKKVLPLGETNARLEKKTIGDFQRWVNGIVYRKGVDFQDYDANARHDALFKLQPDLFAEVA